MASQAQMANIPPPSNSEVGGPNSPLADKGSTFYRAIPYAVATLSIAAIGVTIACTLPGTAALVSGVVLALLGSYAFYGVVACGIAHSDDPNAFSNNVGKYVLTSCGVAIADTTALIARFIIGELVSNMFEK